VQEAAEFDFPCFPAPSAIFAGIDNAARRSWPMSAIPSRRGKVPAMRCTSTASAWDFSQTFSLWKSCMAEECDNVAPLRHPFTASGHVTAHRAEQRPFKRPNRSIPAVPDGVVSP